ncbi:phosphotransferase [Actinocatenispora comari]|uniref:Aminoglycoside phosphotransferase domain-containing protein n=1 Tax=Actinocatenispora comari TaxID=2807577 RepID=A0A8J4ACQ0_9ACTN|nr:phosphotransferase [Actinocatenispora comari]GIL28949.1 hypothetical protein NUM_42030 [Actinocatenispora comari]
MSRPVLAVEASDEVFTAWMRTNLDRAAERFGLRVAGAPVLGWRLRSIGARADGPDGPRWLRVVSEYPEYAGGGALTGNADAGALPLPEIPRVVEVWQWQAEGRVQRAEASTLLPGAVVSTTDVLADDPGLSEEWWTMLRGRLDALRATPTTRVHQDAEAIAERTEAMLGTAVRVQRWETVHGDLHWGNLMRPFGILDWELWGRGPAGTDAATLLLCALPVPAVAERVAELFADMLDTDDGRSAQMAVAARMLARIAGGDYPQLAEPVRHHLARLGVRGYR